MIKRKLPPTKYIHRPEPLDLVAMSVRIPRNLKLELDYKSKQLNTSLNRYVEAALRWYGVELEDSESLDHRA